MGDLPISDRRWPRTSSSSPMPLESTVLGNSQRVPRRKNKSYLLSKTVVYWSKRLLRIMNPQIYTPHIQWQLTHDDAHHKGSHTTWNEWQVILPEDIGYSLSKAHHSHLSVDRFRYESGNARSVDRVTLIIILHTRMTEYWKTVHLYTFIGYC